MYFILYFPSLNNTAQLHKKQLMFNIVELLKFHFLIKLLFRITSFAT